MLKYNLTLVLRRLRKERVFTLVNVLGLTVGLTAFLMIGLYIKHELSFDKFHKDADNIYIIASKYRDREWRGSIASDYVQFFKNDVVGLNDFSRVTPNSGNQMVQVGGKELNVSGIINVDSNFFDFFSFKLISGAPKSVFSNTSSAVISVGMSQILFGEENPIGEELWVEKGKRKYTITGVAEDAPLNSSFNYQIVTFDENGFKNNYEETYGLQTVLTYLNLQSDASLEKVGEQITGAKLKPPYSSMTRDVQYAVFPMLEQRLYADYDQTFFKTNDIRYLQLFGGIGLVVLLLAIINYINLVTTQSIRRGKEIGLRKVIGATKSQLMVFQFVESIVVVVFSFLLAFACTERLLPVFNDLLNKDITLQYFGAIFFLWVLVAGILIGIISGLYPALQMHKVNPINTVKSSVTTTKEKSMFRKVLVLFQFTVTAILTCCLSIMINQMNYLKQKDLGFNTNAIISVPLDRDSTEAFLPLQQEILKISGVQDASISGFRPGGYAFVTAMDAPNNRGEGANSLGGDAVFGDPSFINIMGLEVLWQESESSISDFSEGQVIINRSMANDLGAMEQPEGKRIYGWSEEDEGKRVVAIVEDFHIKSLKDAIEPLTIYPLGDWGSDNILIKLETKELSETIDRLAEPYEEYFGRPFEFSFLNDQIAAFYKKEEGQFKLFQIFSTLAICISLMGLIALTIYTLQQKRKEVSIRKVLGASVQRLLVMLNKEYSALVLIAFVIASPIAYYAMQGWLQEFEYRISLTPFLFVAVFASFLILSWLVTIIQSLKVSSENPADVLREE